MRVEFINPFLTGTQNVFSTMLGSAVTRGPLSLKQDRTPMHEVSGLIGLSGKCRGMVMVSVGTDTALNAAGVLLGHRPEQLNEEVIDAIAEITNMIAGSAKSQLAEYDLSIGLPTVICGKAQTIRFPSEAPAVVIPFESSLGPICVEVGLVEASAQQ